MEKKVTKKFFLLSSLSAVLAVVLAKANLQDSLALLAVLVVLILNHATLLKMVAEVSKSMRGEEGKPSATKILLLMFLKLTLLASVVVVIYFYNKELTPKVLLLMIFQLIIQVVSIKNNY